MAGSPAAVTTAGGSNPIPAAGEVDQYREQLLYYSGAYETAMPDPVLPPTVTSALAGPSLPPGTYVCAYTWANGNGESRLSPTATITVPQGSQITITAPAKPGGVTLIGFYISAYPQYANPGNASFLQRIPELVLAAAPQAGVALVVSALPLGGAGGTGVQSGLSQQAVAPIGTGNGSSDDFKTNAYYSGRPLKVLQNRDATAYAAQTTSDSWIVALRQRGVTQ